MRGKFVLYVDQYGDRVYASTVRQLRRQTGGRFSKMYVDRGDKTIHVGYVCGRRWFTAFVPLELPA